MEAETERSGPAPPWAAQTSFPCRPASFACPSQFPLANFLANQLKNQITKEPSPLQVKLKTWYRHMQTFVGSFSYLGRAQYKFRKDQQKSINEAVTKELHDLLVSARYMLCEIESTINSSYPNSNGAKLSRVSRQAMEDRLNFHTPANGSAEADQRDLKVSKELYFQYLDNVWKTLHRVLRRPRRNSGERRHLAAASAAAGHGAGAAASGLRAGSSEMLDLGSSSGSGGSSGSDGGSSES